MAVSGDPEADAKAARKLPEVERLLKQFQKLESGIRNTDAYKLGWCRNFGRRTGEHGDGSTGNAACSDNHCWCKRDE